MKTTRQNLPDGSVIGTNSMLDDVINLFEKNKMNTPEFAPLIKELAIQKIEYGKRVALQMQCKPVQVSEFLNTLDKKINQIKSMQNMKAKKLVFSSNIMEEFNYFFEDRFKVLEVGQIYAYFEPPKVEFIKCIYDGFALNKQDTPIYIKFYNVEKPDVVFTLVENQTVLIDDNWDIYETNDTGLKTISKNSIENEIKRQKEFKK